MVGRPLPRRALLGAAATGCVGLARAQSVPRRGGSLACFATPEPMSLVPGADPSAAVGTITGKLFEGLLHPSGAGSAQPVLARGWQVSADGRSCRFALRDGVLFHDGGAMTAEDVLFSLARAAARLPGAGLGWIAETATPDASTLVVTGAGRVDRLLPAFAAPGCPILPRHLYADEEAGEIRPVGTGPFRLAEREPGAFLRLRRFPDHWRAGTPVLDEIAYRVVPDADARAAALHGGDAQLAQLLDLPSPALDGLCADPALRCVEPPPFRASVCRLDLNHRRAPLGDPRVRRAIALAADRDDLVRRVWSGAAVAASGPLPDGAEPPARDPRAAAALLTEAGLHPDGRGIRLSLRHVVSPASELWARASTSLAASLRQAGIELVTETAGVEEWARRVAAWEYDSTLVWQPGQGAALLDLATGYASANVRHVPGANTGGYASPAFDAQLLAARDAADDAAHLTALRQAEALLVADAAQVWLVEPRVPAVASRRLRGWDGDPYADFAEAFLD